MLFVIATFALGGLKMCSTMVDITAGPNDAAVCGGTREQCSDFQESGITIGQCKNADGGGAASVKYLCSGNKLVAEIHAKKDCTDDVSTECDNLFAMSAGGCKVTYTIGECEDKRNVSLATVKVTGSCPGADDAPCFSREAEACRIVDTSVAPFAAFRACFDEAAPTVAERVKMTALTGGDYILSAGKDQAYEFTRVIVNQHKLTEARRPATPAHHSPIGLAFALAPSPPPPSVSPPPHCTRAEALEHAQDRPRRR